MLLPFAVALLAAAHFLDWATFLVMVGRHGLDAELNPLVIYLFERSGVVGVTLAKLSAVLFAAGAAGVIIRRRPTMAGVVLGFGIGGGLLGAFSNLLTI